MKSERKNGQAQKILIYLLGLAGVFCVVAGAYRYIDRIRESLLAQTIFQVEVVTRQQQEAFSSFITRDRERIQSFAGDLSRHGSADLEIIREKLEMFSEVEAIYTVLNLEKGEYYNNKSTEIHPLTQEAAAVARGLPDSGIVGLYTDLVTDTSMFAYYQRFTFADGVSGMFHKAYLSERITDEFTLSFYNGEGYSYIVDKEGKVLLHPLVEKNYIGGNIFESFASGEDSRTQLAGLKEALQRGETGALVFQGSEQDYVYAYAPIADMEGGYLISLVPKTAIMAEVDRVADSTEMLLTVAGAGMLVFGVFLALLLRVQRELLWQRQEREYGEEQSRILASYLANNTEDAYLMLREDRRGIEYASPNCQRVLGIAFGDTLEDPELLGYGEDELERMGENEALGPKVARRLHPGTGEQKWFQETVYCAYIQGERKYILYVSDRTKELEAQDYLGTALEVAKVASRAKSDFLSSVSHDIRTPMNAIMGLSVLLQQEADSPGNVLEYARKINASSQHLLGLINDVLDMNKIESGKMALNVGEIRLAEVIEGLNSIIRPQAKAKNQTMAVHASGFRHEYLLGDKTRINQIFVNILSNAVKYTPEGGRIEMTVEELPQTMEGFSHLRFAVRDNGRGMSEEYQKILFDPFTRERSSVINEIQGTGLGMAITKSLVELMGGAISVESRLGEGSVFTVEFVLRIQERAGDPAFWAEYGIQRILVADDDRETCENVVRALADQGAEADYVAEGTEVVRVMREARERGEPYDLLLLDWQMPNLSGLEVARLIRKNYSQKIPIMLFTAYDWTDIEKEAQEVGIDHFMPKPFFVSTFKEAVRRVVHKVSSGGGKVPCPEESAVRGRHILVAEDNKVNMFVLLKILSSRGAACDVAENGEEAVRMFEASGEGEYDLVLMDIKMPVMDGYEATRAIRAGRHPDARTVPIIAMTANAFVDDVAAAKASGMTAHVAKPIVLEQLEARIREVLGGGTGNLQEEDSRKV